MKHHELIIFSGESNTDLAERMRWVTGKKNKLGDIYHHQFPSGEWYTQLRESVRGADVFLVQSISNPANDNLMQLLVMIDAARRASAGRITAVLPYFGYSRQDRKDKPRVPISAKLVLNILEAAGADRVVTMDLHAPQIGGFTDLPFDHLQFRPSLAEELKRQNIDIDTIVAPDVGAIKRASDYAEKMGRDFAFIAKKRKNDTDVEITQFVGDVKDKNVLIPDDLTESAGTIIAAAGACRNNGAKKVYAAVTHPCITTVGFDRLADARKNNVLDGFFIGNTVAQPTIKTDGWWTVVDVANVFAQAIGMIHNDESISSLFV